LVRSSAEREKCLREFLSVLAPKGKLIIDQRNFQYILDEREKILRGNFRYSGNFMYCGHIVTGRPIAVSEANVKFGYFHNELGCVGTLGMYPFKKGELRRLLYSVGFSQVQGFPDFGGSSIETCDFVTYVAVK